MVHNEENVGEGFFTHQSFSNQSVGLEPNFYNSNIGDKSRPVNYVDEEPIFGDYCGNGFEEELIQDGDK